MKARKTVSVRTCAAVLLTAAALWFGSISGSVLSAAATETEPLAEVGIAAAEAEPAVTEAEPVADADAPTADVEVTADAEVTAETGTTDDAGSTPTRDPNATPIPTYNGDKIKFEVPEGGGTKNTSTAGGIIMIIIIALAFIFVASGIVEKIVR